MGFVPSKKKAQSYGDFKSGNTLGAKVGSEEKPAFIRGMLKKSDGSSVFKNTNAFKKRDDEEQDDLEERKKAIQRRLSKKARKAV